MSNSQDMIQKFLAHRTVGVLGTVNEDGNPQNSVIYYSIDAQFNVFFTTKSQTKLCQNLKHNNHVALLVYDASAQTTALISGLVKEVTDDAKDSKKAYDGTSKAAVVNSNDSAAQPPVMKLNAGNIVACKLRPSEIDMKIFSGNKPEVLTLSFA